MLINLSDVQASEGMQITREVPVELTSFESRSGSFEVISKSPVFFTFTNRAPGKVRAEGKVKLTFRAACDRCLEEVPVALDLSFARTVVSSDAEEDGEEDRILTAEGRLDTERFVQNEISINWPVKILCKEDCRGICPVCGQNLNKRDCGCDTFVPDPRMAVIQDIFNKNKEV